QTEMCRSWTETGSCRYGSKCQASFAHGPEELRPVVRHPKYKTEHCRTFAATGICQYGNRCRFIHAAAPGSAVSTPRPLLGPDNVGGGAALQGAAEAAGTAVWSRSAGSPGAANGVSSS
ncbi:CCCH-type zinc finger protein, partial [Volvox carteri f. nagariensis]